MVEKPTTVKNVQGRFSGPEVKQIDDWRRRQAAIPTRSEALRTLVRLGLEKDQRRPPAEHAA